VNDFLRLAHQVWKRDNVLVFVVVHHAVVALGRCCARCGAWHAVMPGACLYLQRYPHWQSISSAKGVIGSRGVIAHRLGECLGGALTVNDFLRLAHQVW
jgi:hypothetical protein